MIFGVQRMVTHSYRCCFPAPISMIFALRLWRPQGAATRRGEPDRDTKINDFCETSSQNARKVTTFGSRFSLLSSGFVSLDLRLWMQSEAASTRIVSRQGPMKFHNYAPASAIFEIQKTVTPSCRCCFSAPVSVILPWGCGDPWE